MTAALVAAIFAAVKGSREWTLWKRRRHHEKAAEIAGRVIVAATPFVGALRLLATFVELKIDPTQEEGESYSTHLLRSHEARLEHSRDEIRNFQEAALLAEAYLPDESLREVHQLWDLFEQIRRGSHQFALFVHDGVACVELSLDQGRRHQAIFLSELDDDDGRPYLRVSTAVAPTTGLDARRALVFNWQSRVGYLGIGDLDGVPYLQLCENRPYQGLDASEVDRLVLEIGGLGDRMERALSADGDLL